jgi:RHS repeat-associated protein
MRLKTFLCFIIFATISVIPAWSFDRVSPINGKIAITQIDHSLITSLGSLPITRSFRSDIETGIMGPGWYLDVISHLDQLSQNFLFVTQAEKPILLVRKGNKNIYRGPAGVWAQVIKGQWVVASPAGITSIYDKKGQEISRSDANGNTIRFAYDQFGHLSEIQAVTGHPLRIRYGDNGLLSSIQDVNGRQSKYHYDAAGRLVEVKDANGRKTTYHYLENKRLSEINYSSGVKVNFWYDKSGKISKRQSSSGNTYTYSYDKATRITRHDGFWWETEYNKRGLPLKHRDSLEREQSWHWDNQNQLIKRRFFDGSFKKYTYDSQGRMVSQETGTGDILKIAYNNANSRLVKIDHNGAITRFTYDKNSNLLSVISPAGRKAVYRYDEHGRRISITDGEGRTTGFEYDTLGNMVKQTNPDKSVISWQYNKNGRMIRQIDPLGNFTTIAYKPGGMIDSITRTGGESTSYQYNGFGQLIKETIGTHTIRYTYNKRGLLGRIDYPEKMYENITYDSLGNPLKFTDVLGRVTRQEFDLLNRLIKTRAPSGMVMSNTFTDTGKLESIAVGHSKVRIASDDGGRTVRLTDTASGIIRITKDKWGHETQRVFPGGGQEQRKYDPDGFLKSVTLPMGDTWSFEHNRAGQLKKVIFPDGGIRKLAYAPTGRIASIIYPSGKKVSYRYSSTGLLLETTNARGQKIEYRYDKSGRVIFKKMPNDNWNYRYDARGNLVQAGNRRFTIRYSYDRLGRPIQIEYPKWGKIIKYEYDKFGRIIGRTDPEGNQTRYRYDKLGRVSRIRIETRAGTAFSFIYDDAGRLVKRKAGNKTITDHKYDTTGRVVSIVHRGQVGELLAAASYRYDLDGNRVEVIDKDENKSVYRYDSERRLIGETGPLGRKKYVYGPGGKRTSVTGQSGAAVYRYDKAGRLVRAGKLSFYYDADGNVVSRKNKDGTTRYSYDSENNLIKVVPPDGKIVAYGYGPFGKKIWREVDSKRTYYLQDGDNLLQELSAEYKPLSTYLYAGLDKPLMAFSKDGAPRFFHQDDLGSVLAVSNGKGKITAGYRYDAFGNVMKQEGKDANQPFRFTGRPLDSATGLYDLRARFYDSKTGQFTSHDPVFGNINDPATLSPYIYARNNPLSYIDPFGKSSLYRDFWINIRQRPPFFCDPHMMHQVFFPPGSKLDSPMLADLAENYALLKTKFSPQDAEYFRGRMNQNLLNRLPKPGNARPGFLSRAASYARNAAEGIRRRLISQQPTVRVNPNTIGSGGTVRVDPNANSSGGALAKTGPSVQKMGATAGMGILAMEVADIVAEPLSAAYHGEDASAEVDEAAEKLTGLAKGIAGAGLLIYAGGSLAPAAVPVILTGAAVVATVGLAHGAGRRLGTAYHERKAAINAEEQEMIYAIRSGEMHKLFQENQSRICDDIEDKIIKIKTLLGGDLKELAELEMEVANRRNRAVGQKPTDSDLRGIDERITVMEGTVKNWGLAQKKYNEVRKSLNTLKNFDDIAEDLSYLGEEFNTISLPDVKNATKLLAQARNSRTKVELSFVETKDTGWSGSNLLGSEDKEEDGKGTSGWGTSAPAESVETPDNKKAKGGSDEFAAPGSAQAHKAIAETEKARPGGKRYAENLNKFLSDIEREQARNQAEANEFLNEGLAAFGKSVGAIADLNTKSKKPPKSKTPALPYNLGPVGPNYNPTDGWGKPGQVSTGAVKCPENQKTLQKKCESVNELVQKYQALFEGDRIWKANIQRAYLFRAQCCGYRWTNEGSGDEQGRPDNQTGPPQKSGTGAKISDGGLGVGIDLLDVEVIDDIDEDEDDHSMSIRYPGHDGYWWIKTYNTETGNTVRKRTNEKVK